MALAATTVWEVRTGGSDDNGGGYKSDAGTTDYSLQAAAQLTVADGATSGIGVTTLTSVTGGFTAQMVGNMVHLYSGVNLTDGWYEISAYTDTNTVTLDRAPDDGVGAMSSADVKVGGYFATPGRLGKTLLDHGVSGMKGWIKAATYTLTTSTDGPGGPFDLGSVAADLVIEGYQTTRGDLGTAPVLNAGAQTSVTLWSSSKAGNSHHFINLKADGNSGANNCGFFIKYCEAFKCEAVNCPLYGFYATSLDGGKPVYCKATGGVYPFYYLRFAVGCVSIGGTRGFRRIRTSVNCIAHGASTYGFDIDGASVLCLNCTADGDSGTTDDGFNLSGGAGTQLINCVATNCGQYGFNLVDATKAYRTEMVNCAGYNNTSGNINLQSSLGVDEGFVILTADPYEAVGSDDFRPNDTVGGGAELRGGGIGAGSLLVSDNQNIGAVQHADQVSLVQARRNMLIGR